MHKWPRTCLLFKSASVVSSSSLANVCVAPATRPQRLSRGCTAAHRTSHGQTPAAAQAAHKLLRRKSNLLAWVLELKAPVDAAHEPGLPVQNILRRVALCRTRGRVARARGPARRSAARPSARGRARRGARRRASAPAGRAACVLAAAALALVALVLVPAARLARHGAGRARVRAHGHLLRARRALLRVPGDERAEAPAAPRELACARAALVGVEIVCQARGRLLGRAGRDATRQRRRPRAAR